jgi:SAM-dependent methyltransferase
MAICNVCGGSRFGPGPAGRLSRRGLPPRCSGCGSLERHRAIRVVVDKLREIRPLEKESLIRFSDDPILDDRWFRTAEVSIFHGPNSLDIQAIDRSDASYDVVLCSHVIEHVADDRAAIGELTRILSPQGFLLLAFPRVEHGDRTDDWGFADPRKNGHFRGYGRDFDEVIAASAPGAQMLAIVAEDPVTGDPKKFAIVCKSREDARRFRACLKGARLVSARA